MELAKRRHSTGTITWIFNKLKTKIKYEWKKMKSMIWVSLTWPWTRGQRSSSAPAWRTDNLAKEYKYTDRGPVKLLQMDAIYNRIERNGNSLADFLSTIDLRNNPSFQWLSRGWSQHDGDPSCIEKNYLSQKMWHNLQEQFEQMGTTMSTVKSSWKTRRKHGRQDKAWLYARSSSQEFFSGE